MQLKTADHKYFDVMEAILSPCDITIPPNDRVTIQTHSESFFRTQCNWNTTTERHIA